MFRGTQRFFSTMTANLSPAGILRDYMSQRKITNSPEVDGLLDVFLNKNVPRPQHFRIAANLGLNPVERGVLFEGLIQKGGKCGPNDQTGIDPIIRAQIDSLQSSIRMATVK